MCVPPVKPARYDLSNDAITALSDEQFARQWSPLARNIADKFGNAERRFGLTPDDLASIALAHMVQKRNRYDPAKAKWITFLSNIGYRALVSATDTARQRSRVCRIYTNSSREYSSKTHKSSSTDGTFEGNWSPLDSEPDRHDDIAVADAREFIAAARKWLTPRQNALMDELLAGKGFATIAREQNAAGAKITRSAIEQVWRKAVSRIKARMVA
jgi:hypothetical protein